MQRIYQGERRKTETAVLSDDGCPMPDAVVSRPSTVDGNKTETLITNSQQQKRTLARVLLIYASTPSAFAITAPISAGESAT
jgi:hypothetical protein